MIDPVLKKFGLSEARRSVKKINNSTFTKTPVKQSTPNTSQKKQLNQTQEIPQTPRENKTTLLQKLISYLRSNYNKICPNHTSNGTNRIKFVCLNQPCSQNLGCAECFLYRHADHTKAQIGTCIRQLQDLDYFLKDSYDSIISQKSVIKSKFITQIDLQINHMCDEFHRTLQFLKNKALKQVDDHLFSKYEELQVLNSLRNNDRERVSEQLLIGELMRIDIKGIERNLNVQIRELGYERLNVQPIVKFFQEMNGALGYFMAEFKKCFPKIYAFQDETTFNESKIISRDQIRFNTVSEFKSNENNEQSEKASQQN